uniref:Uncharacterized protein n=1 Tax=Pinguiococcus pyrenoidosus TaxID=172671 RepID=A0A7R9UES9_9STRA|mmetsp:Transcript_8151/g.30629  ORF Transcript_8151/g.30629 Transcript_8151/m.30629 type:complete len:211 (+) Transcript_8151:2-634(+)
MNGGNTMNGGSAMNGGARIFSGASMEQMPLSRMSSNDGSISQISAATTTTTMSATNSPNQSLPSQKALASSGSVSTQPQQTVGNQQQGMPNAPAPSQLSLAATNLDPFAPQVQKTEQPSYNGIQNNQSMYGAYASTGVQYVNMGAAGQHGSVSNGVAAQGSASHVAGGQAVPQQVQQQQDASVQNHQQGFAQIAMRLSGRDLGQQQSGVR